MRRASLAALAALALSASVLSGPAVARDAEARFYEGTTPDGAVVRFEVWVSSTGVAHLAFLSVRHAPYSCEDGTEDKTETGVGWVPGRYGPVIEDQHLELSENWGSVAFTVSGRVGLHRGSGTLTFVMAGLTADEQAQVCTMGFAWTLERTTAAGSPFRRSTALQHLGGGRIVMMGSRATGSTATTAVPRGSAAPVRHYHGRTSAGKGMKAYTQRVDAGIELLRLAFGYNLTCDDGNNIEGRWVNFPIPSSTVMQPGRFDFDYVGNVDLAVGLHIDGDLDAHAGAGTLAHAAPQLTEDLQATLCASGELTWEQWRTDAGY